MTLYRQTNQNPKQWRRIPGAQEWLLYIFGSNFPCAWQGDLVKHSPRLPKLGLDSVGFTSFITGKSLRLSWHQQRQRCSPDNEKFLFTE